MFKHMKRSTAVIFLLTILALTTVVVYAVTTLFFKGETQTSDYSKKTYFEFAGDGFFTASGEVGPGESNEHQPRHHFKGYCGYVCVHQSGDA